MCARLPDDVDDVVTESATNVASQRGGNGDDEDGKLAAVLNGVACVDCVVGSCELRHEEIDDVGKDRSGMVRKVKDTRTIIGYENDEVDLCHCRIGMNDDAKSLDLALTLDFYNGVGVGGPDVISSSEQLSKESFQIGRAHV